MRWVYIYAAAIIKGNPSNCKQFATFQRLDWLVHWLSAGQQSPKGSIQSGYIKFQFN